MSQGDVSRPRRRIPIWVWFAAANVLVLVAAGTAYYLFFAGGRSTAVNPRSIAPAPLRRSRAMGPPAGRS